MIWSLELHGFMAAVSVSFLSGMLMDMLLKKLAGKEFVTEFPMKKLTGSEKVRYVAVLAAAATAIVMGTYGMGLHTFACILFLQVLLFAAEYDMAAHTVPDYVPVLILLAGMIEVEFAPALLGLVLVPLPFLAAALIKEAVPGGGFPDGIYREKGQGLCAGAVSGSGMPAFPSGVKGSPAEAGKTGGTKRQGAELHGYLTNVERF